MIKFPFFNVQEMNLDWLLTTVQKILNFLPINSGVAGDVLQRGTDGAVWQPIAAVSMDIHSLAADAPDPTDELPIYDTTLQGNYKVTVQDIIDLVPAGVSSVNGQTGAVTLSIPTMTSDLVNDEGFVDAAGAAAAAPVQSVNGQTGAVTISAGVTSVNGQTGAVTLSIPSDTSDLTNTAGYVNAAGAAAAAPVQSVNGMTGAVTVSGGGSPTLVWTNNAPSSAFAAQNVSVNLSAYSFIIIEYAAFLTETVSVSSLFKMSTSGRMQTAMKNGTAGYISVRDISVSSSGVSFSGGEYFNTYGSTTTSNDSVCVPLHIYGIA